MLYCPPDEVVAAAKEAGLDMGLVLELALAARDFVDDRCARDRAEAEWAWVEECLGG